MFRYVFAPACALLFCCVVPVCAEDGWIADEKSGCKLWARNVEPGDSVIWNGGCKNGLAEGRATYQFMSNGKWIWKGEAEFHEGKREGRGSAVNADGVHIEGDYRGGVLNGRVIESDAEIGRYVGEYRNGERNGTGRYTYGNGDYYEGAFRDGLPNGAGTFKGHNNVGGISLYAGDWRDGCFDDGDRTVAVLRSREECGFK